MIGPFCMTLRLRRHFEKQQKPRTDLIQIKPVWINNSMKTAVISFTTEWQCLQSENYNRPEDGRLYDGRVLRRPL